jgi:hypothetical protein
MRWTPNDLTEYCSSKAYHDDYAAASHPILLKPSRRSGSYDYLRETSHGCGVNSMTHPVTINAFHQGIKQDNTFHRNLKENKHSNTWNQSFVAPSQMEHTLLVYNGHDFRKNDEKNAFCRKYSCCTIFSENT